MKIVNIVVPVYADWKSLKLNIDSLKRYYADNNEVRVYYVNDCGPEAEYLEKKINQSIGGLKNFHYSKNDKNLGFVKNCNNAVFNIVKNKKADVLLLNSDTKVTSGFLEEMWRVLYSEDNIATVNPRSNNATVWSVPMDARLKNKPRKSYKLWHKIKDSIPDKYIAPTSHGFCMLIRRSVIDDIGLFDEVYGRGYGEENDFTMRARANGWVCAVANHSFVFHLESKSFGNEAREILIAENAKILTHRYPDYNRLISEYTRGIKEPQPVPPIPLRAARRIRIANTSMYHFIKLYGKKTLLTSIRKRLGGEMTRNTNGRLHIWTHEVSYTGAPLVLMDIIRSWKAEGGLLGDVKYSIPRGYRIDKPLLYDLNKEGINFEVEDQISTVFHDGDIVVLNSSAYPVWLYEKLFTGLLKGGLKHLFFYVHEDDDSMTGVLGGFVKEINQLIKQDKITIYVPSDGSRRNWTDFFNTEKSIYTMSGRVVYSDGMFEHRNDHDFGKVNFITAGTNEPRKGHLAVEYAVLSFYNNIYRKNPDRYRDFSLTIAGVKNPELNKGDYYNTFVINTAAELPGKIKLEYEPDLSTMHNLMRKCNFTINYSIKESFSIVTMEGMSFGHPIIRAESSGRDEQLMGNGYAVDTRNWSGLVDVIEEVLNKRKTSNNKFLEMSKTSMSIARKSHESRYRIIDDISRL